ncbi:MAG: PQQ-binding-like beta-propeller repeat protein [Verrucomicrobiota bacterium]
MMNRRAFSSLLAAGLAVLPLQPAAMQGADNPAEAGWNQFRGPHGNGHGDAAGLPLKWSDTENVAWKVAIPHKGWSTPLILGNQVWLTTATEDGKEYWAYCLDRSTGKILHEVKLFTSEAPEPLGNALNSYASPTGFLEKGRVYLHFGSYGTACLDTTTFKELWRRTDLPCRHYRGPGSSVFPWKETLILTMDGVDVQYLTALDKKTGATVWKTDRNTEYDDLDAAGKPMMEGDYRKAYSTPILIDPGGKPQLVSTGSRATVGYDPDTGKELWRARYKGFSNASLPTWVDGLLVLNTGHGKAILRAYRITPETTGDITDALVWEQTKYIPTRSSPVVAEGLIYVMADNGFLSAVDPKNGELLFSERTGGSCSSSPLFADGKLIFCNERGESYVVQPGRTYQELARNSLPEGIMAGPAAAGADLFLRTKTHLYCIRKLP